MSDPGETEGWRSRLRGWAGRASAAADEARAWSRRMVESERVREARERLAASPVWLETARAAGRVRQSDAWKRVEESASRAAERARETARGAGDRLERARHELEALVGALDRAGRAPDDRATVLRSAVEAFERAGPHLDLLADAVAVGVLQEAGAGVASIQGTELLFVPADGPVRAQLRVARIIGQSARLAVGGQVGGYVAAFYGPRDLMVRPLDRRGADLGVLVASLGFFRATASAHGSVDPAAGPPTRQRCAGGWIVELAAGAALGIPILSDLSAFELEEVGLASYSLTAAEAEPIDSALAQAPDRPQRRKVALLLARDVGAKPG